jgi:[acyl-carrier-protein] S-malonyltransferase
VTAQVMQFSEIKDLLVRQIKSPVHFDESIVKMKKMGVNIFIEIGPGKVLSGFVRKIDQDLRVTNLENEKTYQQILAILGEK